MNIFVGSLSFQTTEAELQREFEQFGEVHSLQIIKDQYTHKSRGFAFVEMNDREQALAAIAGLNGKELGGHTLKVNEARPKGSGGGGNRERSSGNFGGAPRSGGGPNFRDSADIYDSKDRSGGGYGRRGSDRRGPGSGGRSSGGKRSR